MAASDMMSALMELCQEKHIDQLYLIDRLEQSLAKSYAEILHLEWGAKVTIDRTTGKIYVYRLEPIDDSMDEEGNFTEFEEIDVTPKNTSRIAAQHAVHVIGGGGHVGHVRAGHGGGHAHAGRGLGVRVAGAAGQQQG